MSTPWRERHSVGLSDLVTSCDRRGSGARYCELDLRLVIHLTQATSELNPLRIVLDTNVIQEDFLMRSGRFTVLFDYAKKSESQFALTQLVHDELIANYRRELQARFSKCLRAKEQTNGLLPTSLDIRIELDVPAAADEYERYLLKQLGLAADEVIPHRNEHLPELISRAIQRRRPCTDRGEEIRDALLWQTALEVAADAAVALISKNTDQFSHDKQSLHPDLVAEAAARGARIQYYPSLEEFARQHATPIAFITTEWLEAHIKADDILEGSRGIVESYIDHWFHEQGGSGASLTGYVNMLTGHVHVDDYFVYELGPSEYRLEVTWLGFAEVEYEVEAVEKRDVWDYDYEFSSETGQYEYIPVTRQEHEARARTLTREVKLSVVTEVFIKHGNVERFRSIDGWVL